MRVGLTGGIGSGKTLVSRIFSLNGAAIFYSDQEAKRIINENPTAIEEITALLGAEAYLNSIYNVPFVSKKVFENPELRLSLNSIVHHLVRAEFNEFCQNNPNSICINEAAILYETQAHSTFDKIILVTAPMQTRINRIMKRDNSTLAQVQLKMQNQWSDEEKRKFNPIEIINDESKSLLIEVQKTYDYLLSLKSSKSSKS
jgi:dephospho-CoA kinase